MNPTGGLPRRKSALAQLTLKGPSLVFDAGNALFMLEGKGQPELEPRARFILQTMAKLGVKVMAAGAKDLGPGATWLKAEAAKAGVQIVSANLEEDGKRVFEGSTVLTAGGVRVGFIGLSPVGETVGNTPMIATPILPAVKAELAKLKGKTDLVIVLAAIRQVDAFEVAKAFKNEVDFVIRSGEQQGNIPAQRTDDSAWVMTGGMRGQSVVSVALKLGGTGPFIDLSEVAREKELLASLDVKIKEMEARAKAAKDPESKKLMDSTLKELQSRRAEQNKKVAPGVSPTARTFDLNYAVLDASVVDEPALKTEVLKYEPTYAGAH